MCRFRPEPIKLCKFRPEPVKLCKFRPEPMELCANSDRGLRNRVQNKGRRLWNCGQIQTGAYGTVYKFRPEPMKLYMCNSDRSLWKSERSQWSCVTDGRNNLTEGQQWSGEGQNVYAVTQEEARRSEVADETGRRRDTLAHSSDDLMD